MVHKGDATVTITAMPAKHATEEAVNELLMPVNGHMLDFSRNADHLYRLYITGDTMLVDSLKDIPRRYPDIDLGLIHTGGTTFLVTVVTMTGEQGVQAVEITKPRTAIPIHYNDFSVFLSGLDDFKKAAQASTTTRSSSTSLTARPTPSSPTPDRTATCSTFRHEHVGLRSRGGRQLRAWCANIAARLTACAPRRTYGAVPPHLRE